MSSGEAAERRAVTAQLIAVGHDAVVDPVRDHALRQYVSRSGGDNPAIPSESPAIATATTA